GEILNSPEYQLFEDARKLTEKGVFFLNQWKEFGQKDTVPLRTKGRLDAALQQVEEAEEAEKEIQENEKPPRQPLPEGFYESVFDATWSHVMGFPEDEDEYMVVRMEVREGKRPQELWKYMRQMNTSFSVSGDEQFRPPRVELMILSSEKLWPHSLNHSVRITNCYINIEVHQVWKIVEGDLKGVFLPAERGPPCMRRRLLVGAPGVGESMAADSYLLHQLLHHDGTKLHVVVFCFGRDFAYLFDKRTRTVTIYEGESNIRGVMVNLAGSGMKGYIIIDMAIHFREPSNDVVPSPEWGIITLSSPHENNFKQWAEQAEYWRRMHMHTHDVGPIPRCIFQFNEYEDRVEEIKDILVRIDASNAVHYGMIGGMGMYPRMTHLTNL
ncbi:retrotransposon hot spot (RHS) protein, partial [Trypanosoma rangeli]